MWIDTTVFLETNFNIFTAWPRPIGAQYMAEVHDPNTDIPGTASRMTDWSTMTIQYYSDDSYHNTCGSITLHREVDRSNWDSDAPNCNHVRSWSR